MSPWGAPVPHNRTLKRTLSSLHEMPLDIFVMRLTCKVTVRHILFLLGLANGDAMQPCPLISLGATHIFSQVDGSLDLITAQLSGEGAGSEDLTTAKMRLFMSLSC